MAIRFRKRLKILPGVYLNIGKRGITSTSIGFRGANVTLGKKSRVNVGLPGTGISTSHALHAASTQEPKPKVPSESRKSTSILLFLVVLAVLGGAGAAALFGILPSDVAGILVSVWCWVALLVAWKVARKHYLEHRAPATVVSD